ncbi:hypothetical protein [Acetohalobium arabaticum]|uniref:Uncharacterized protein n=1 Tax=Acetohalobium arabaticum (strain ATCC 49924 / DSM 5501 / Z-7288) TaxID=574087 RepID=D9QSB4_ACEAZ|nr:hypothetical protein [Acetohalobium arabaticum]ADL11570.1 hypothetical protein Acear_0018 [Acetohalobium arabaticum DSM 5501]
MTDSAEMEEGREVDSISESETSIINSNQESDEPNEIKETSDNKTQEELKDKSPEAELQQKESNPYCIRTKMSGSTRLIIILIVILILQKITAGTDLFC